jgi:two-component system cell cycle sensor histidine kinase/response regulator CckA
MDGMTADRHRGGGERAGSIAGAIGLAVVMAAATVAFGFMTREEAEPYVLVVLGVLATAGLLALFALAVGLVRLGRPQPVAGLGDDAVDGVPEGLVVTDAAGRVLYANAAYLMLAGLDAARRGEAPSLERLIAGDADAAEPMFRLAGAARGGGTAEEEIRLSHPIAHPSGSPRWYRLSVRPLPGPGSRRLWRVADVTAERREQETSFLELQNVINFLDRAPAGFFSADAEGRIVYLNATLAGWLGHDLARLNTGRMALPDIVRGDGAALLSSLVGRPGDERTETVDLDLIKKNGQSLPARLLHRVSFGPGGTARDSRTLVLSRAPGEEVAESLRAAEVRFARFFNNAPIAIAAVDRDGRIGRANAPFLRLFGALAHRPPGEPRPRLAEALVERDRLGFGEALAAAAAGQGVAAPFDATLAGEGGRSVRFYISPVKETDTAGDDEAAIVYALETTEQRALETQFAQSQKMQAVGQLAGGVAHDFNNLLTAIIGFADLVLTRYRPNDPFFQDIMSIKQNANRAAGLVRQLLAFSRRQTMRPERIVLNDVLADLTILLDRLLGETVELKVVHGRDLWPVMADVNQFEQVIVNLAVNARDAMPEGGRLTIRTANVPLADSAAYAGHGIPAGDYVLAEISDTGKGMPAEVIEKIFEPFFTTKERGKGTGLGLSTVYGIVKQSGGYITVDSAPGEGTTFRVLLPRAAGEAAARPPPPTGEEARPVVVRGLGAPLEPRAVAPPPPEPPPIEIATQAVPESAGPSRGPASVAEAIVGGSAANRADPAPPPPDSRDAPPMPPAASADASPVARPVADLTGNAAILLVEDEDAVRAFATRALVSRGYTVHQAASGAEALKVMEEAGGQIDLVVSDVVMPEMDGPTLLRELRRTRPDLKIIFVSGYAEDAFARNLPENERFSFLPKPFTLKQLATAVKTVLAGEELTDGA